MSIPNLNNISPISQMLVSQPTRVERIQSIERRVNEIDSNIVARENSISSNNKVIDATQDHITNIESLIKVNDKMMINIKEDITLRKEHIKTLTESRDLDHKMIANNDKMIDLLESALTRKRSLSEPRIAVADSQQGAKVRLTPAQERQSARVESRGEVESYKSAKAVAIPVVPATLKSNSEILTKHNDDKINLPKGTLIKEQSAKIEDRVNKTNIAIDYHEKQIAKLSNSDKVKNTTATTLSAAKKKEGLVSSYKPPTDQIRSVTLERVKQPAMVDYTKPVNLENLRLSVYNSQKNMYDSMVSKILGKLV